MVVDDELKHKSVGIDGICSTVDTRDGCRAAGYPSALLKVPLW